MSVKSGSAASRYIPLPRTCTTGAAGRMKERTAALQELIDLARHITDLITGHADAALVASREPTTARPLEPQAVDRGVRSTARELDRAEETPCRWRPS